MTDDSTGRSRRARLPHRLLASGLVASLATGVGVEVPPTSDSLETVRVSESDVADACSGGDALFYRTARRGDATDTFVRGAGDTSSGQSSVQFATSRPGDRLFYHTYGYGIAYGDPGVRLADVTTLDYDTYTADSSLVPVLTLEIAPDGPGTSSVDEFATLTFDPSLTGTVVPGEWQRWDALTADASLSLSGSTEEGARSWPVTWDRLLERYPDATVKYGFGVGVDPGREAPGFVGNVSDLTIGVNGKTTRYNFEGRGASSQ